MEFNTFMWIAIFASLATIINGLGIFTIYKNKRWAEKAVVYFLCFAAGVLISVPLMFSFPQAINKNFYAGFAALVGFLFMFFSNQIISRITKQKSLAFGVVAAEGIGIHSFIDGIIYTVTFSVSTLIGFVAGTGLVIHEFAEGVIIFSVLIGGGLTKKKAAVYSFLVAAITTPIGAFVVYPFISRIDSSSLGLALGFVSGILIYTSASHLLPVAQEHKKKHSMVAFLAGVGTALFFVFTKLV
jgi:zinc and cadmium transporter